MNTINTLDRFSNSPFRGQGGIIPLSEGRFTIDKSKVFIPFNGSPEALQTRPAGSLLVEIQPFVIITEKEVILLDTGLGYTDANNIPQLHNNLLKVGINPSQVTKVLLSHLHKDHAGGVSFLNKQTEERFISFPYATWYIQREEFEYALSSESASYVKEDFALLEQFSNVVWLTEPEGRIDNFICYQVTGAHSKFHQVFWIEHENRKIFFGGDVAPQLQQMKSKFVAKYDFDGRKCMELRKEWWEKGRQENWTFLFYHDIASPVWPEG